MGTEWRCWSGNSHLRSNEVHLWRVNLAALRDSSPDVSLLSPEESARAERLLDAPRKEYFMASRVALRRILAEYLRQSPQSLHITLLPGGKPVLATHSDQPHVQFNLSHSGNWLVVALAADITLGVDIEIIKPVPHKQWALQNLFSVADRQELAHFSDELQELAFLRAWTKKEAVLKALGSGFAHSNDVIQADCLSERRSASQAYTLIHGKPFWIAGFEPAPGYLGTLAVNSKIEPIVRFFEFQGMDSFNDDALARVAGRVQLSTAGMG